ncbi:MAG TPA: carboxylating nicotinate-nucleotide diphosphorylase [Pyrinomonadaceae bacterium]|nr:carboxylating nicotinate-nucleotide diphosphorylase [Pyrinomonadaceae bacterium]
MKSESAVIDAMLPTDVLECVKRALAEDIGDGDVTTEAIVPVEATLNGNIVAKQQGVIAGLDVARATFLMLDDRVIFKPKVREGAQVSRGDLLANVSGPARALLSGERTALNFLGRMSGIATLTSQFVEAVLGTSTIILDTRKTAPGLRSLDKLAVKRGGGENHRMGLFDMVLIKDNHIDFAGSITAAVERVRTTKTNLEIEVEARTLKDVTEALALNVDRILLDNMELETIREAVHLNHRRAKLEASGNVTIENVRAIAETGVDSISVGALTHSAKVFDVSLKWTG